MQTRTSVVGPSAVHLHLTTGQSLEPFGQRFAHVPLPPPPPPVPSFPAPPPVPLSDFPSSESEPHPTAATETPTTAANRQPVKILKKLVDFITLFLFLVTTTRANLYSASQCLSCKTPARFANQIIAKRAVRDSCTAGQRVADRRSSCTRQQAKTVDADRDRGARESAQQCHR